MSEELDTEQSAQEEVNEEVKEEAKGKPFTEDQEQYLGSWLGRIVAKQLEKSHLDQQEQRTNYVPPEQTNELVKGFNEKLYQQAFVDGDFLGAVEKARDVLERKTNNISSAKTKQTDKELMQYSETPIYKDIFSDMQKIAHEAAGRGFPPKEAAEYAFNKAKADYLEAGMRGDMELEMLEGGISRKRTKKAKLPPEFKDACERDISAGLFKDESDYIANLAPQIRKQYGI